MLCFKIEDTASSSSQLLLFPITKHLRMFADGFLWSNHSAEVIKLGFGGLFFCSSPALSFHLRNIMNSNFHFDAFGPMSNLTLLVSKCNPIKESFISLQDNTLPLLFNKSS